MRTQEARLQSVQNAVTAKLRKSGSKADKLFIANADSAYYEARVVEALFSVNDSLRASREFVTGEVMLQNMSKLDNALATVTIVMHDTIPLVEWPQERLTVPEHKVVRGLTERLRKRLTDYQLLRPGILSENHPLVVAATRDVITWVKSVHLTMGLATEQEKAEAAQALK